MTKQTKDVQTVIDELATKGVDILIKVVYIISYLKMAFYCKL